MGSLNKSISYQFKLQAERPFLFSDSSSRYWLGLSFLLIFGFMLGCSNRPTQPHPVTHDLEAQSTPLPDTSSQDQSVPPEVEDKSTQSRSLPNCEKLPIRLYEEGSAKIMTNVDMFIEKISQFNDLKEDFNKQLYRSRVMIIFGEDLIQRLNTLELITQCNPLNQRYLKDRSIIFRKLDELIKQQAGSQNLIQ